MESPPDILLGLAVAVGVVALGVLAWLLLRLYRYVSEGRSVYSGAVEPARARFLFAAFGLSEKHLRALHWDGRLFHVGGGARPSAAVTSITCSPPRAVTVSNARVAHTEHWRHQRRDGKPDARYARNSKTLHATRYTLRFAGASPARLDIYDNGSLLEECVDAAFAEMTKPLWSLFGPARLAALPAPRSVEDIVARANRFLGLAQAYDLEAYLAAYTRAAEELVACQQDYYAALAAKGRADAALEAAERRVSAGRTGALQNLRERALAEQQALADTLDGVSAQVAAARTAWVGVVQEVRDLDVRQGKLTQQ